MFFPNEILHRTRSRTVQAQGGVGMSWDVRVLIVQPFFLITFCHPTWRLTAQEVFLKKVLPSWYGIFPAFQANSFSVWIYIYIYIKHLDSCLRHSKCLISVSHHCYFTAWSAYFSSLLSLKHRLAIKFLVFNFYFTLLPWYYHLI